MVEAYRGIPRHTWGALNTIWKKLTRSTWYPESISTWSFNPLAIAEYQTSKWIYSRSMLSKR